MPATTIDTKASASIGASRTKVGTYSVPADRVAVVIGMTVTNAINAAVKVTVEYSPNGSTFFKIISGLSLAVGETLAPLQALGKIAIPETGGMYVTSDTALSVDAVMTVAEKDQA